MKNEKMKWYFLIAVALVVGAIIGYFATSNLTTEGNAIASTKSTALPAMKTTGSVLLPVSCASNDTILETLPSDGSVVCACPSIGSSTYCGTPGPLGCTGNNICVTGCYRGIIGTNKNGGRTIEYLK